MGEDHALKNILPAELNFVYLPQSLHSVTRTIGAMRQEDAAKQEDQVAIFHQVFAVVAPPS
jgi:hypothetical protein